MPSHIEQVQREYRDHGLTVLAIDIKEDPGTIARWTAARGITSRVLLDRDAEVAIRYRVTGTPTVVLVDRSGRVVARGSGTRDWTGPHGRALLRHLLAAGR